jgi:hypothetical protein
MTDQLMICELADCKPLGHPLWEIAGFGRAEIIGEWDVPFVKIFRLVHYTEKNEKFNYLLSYPHITKRISNSAHWKRYAVFG